VATLGWTDVKRRMDGWTRNEWMGQYSDSAGKWNTWRAAILPANPSSSVLHLHKFARHGHV
jgi:hypothetical protein